MTAAAARSTTPPALGTCRLWPDLAMVAKTATMRAVDTKASFMLGSSPSTPSAAPGGERGGGRVRMRTTITMRMMIMVITMILVITMIILFMIIVTQILCSEWPVPNRSLFGPELSGLADADDGGEHGLGDDGSVMIMVMMMMMMMLIMMMLNGQSQAAASTFIGLFGLELSGLADADDGREHGLGNGGSVMMMMVVLGGQSLG
jgi:hypothetical protein